MIFRLIRNDFLKIKRKGFWLLVFLGPFGVVALQMVNYGVRKEYLLAQSDNDWLYYLHNVHSFTPLALVLGIVILTSLMGSIENETNAWKQYIALPVLKKRVYLAKFLVLAILLFISSVLLMLFSFLYGLSLGLGEEVPYKELFKYSFYPYFAALPILSLQLWLQTTSLNSSLPIVAGVLGVIFTFMSYSLPDWFPWRWPTLLNQWEKPHLNALMGIVGGGILYLAGRIHFARKDVK